MNHDTHIPLEERLIFALDVPQPETALDWVARLDGTIRFFKVGLQLFLAGGWPMVEAIRNRGNRVMLDLKFFDIPETVHQAVRQLHNRGVDFATIHGNRAIVEAAVAARGEGLRLLAVTVLTSFDESDLREMGLTGSIADLVASRAARALELGCDGVVASPLEAGGLRRRFGDRFLVVTPGIRPGANREDDSDDQRRIATARQAMADGADHVVVGRPIARAADPVRACAAILEEISAGLAQRTGPPT